MRTSPKKGFTLLEVLVVIMIIAIMTAITGVYFRGKQGTDLDSIGRILVADLRYVRSKALVGSADSALTFDVASRKYFSRDATIDRSLPQEISIAVTVDEHDIDGTRGRIVFYPDGSSSGGKIRLSKNGRQLEVITSWLNGYVTLRR
jgi:general secretion pathway protein H